MKNEAEEPKSENTVHTANDASDEFLLKLREEPQQAPPSSGPGRRRDAAARPRKAADHRLARAQAPRLLIIGFAGIVFLGTLILKLPAATTTGASISWIEAVFTSTSAVTVTGLGVLTTSTDFSRFGQLVILILLQLGGVGFIAFSVLLFRLVGRQVTLNERFVIQQSLGADKQFTLTRNWGGLAASPT